MKSLKTGIAALMIAALAVTAVAVVAQTPEATETPAPSTQTQPSAGATNQAKPPMQNGRPGRGQRGMGGAFQVIADALGVDLATLQSDLQSGKTIADIAKEKNVELSAVVDAVVAQGQTALTQAVTDGRLTQEQADAQIAVLKANLNVMFTTSMAQGAGNRPGFGQMGNGMFDVLAKALGVDVAALQTDLKAGKTIADIAKEKNVELSTVVDAVVAEREAALKAAVSSGRLTQEQADAQIALMKANMTATFSQTMGRGFGMMGMGGFDGGFGGPMGGFDGRGDGGFGRPDGNGNGGRPGNRPGGNGNGGRPGNRPGGNGNNAPVAPEATPESTATANA
ncbi:MAG: hypothetical protein GC179_25005 [Anaerolineaceae bacterium]|nr:hypothetical protein [Anaerolineaceae bacterium]